MAPKEMKTSLLQDGSHPTAQLQRGWIATASFVSEVGPWCPETSVTCPVFPSTSRPEHRVDLAHLRAASSLLSALVPLPPSVGGDDRATA